MNHLVFYQDESQSKDRDMLLNEFFTLVDGDKDRIRRHLLVRHGITNVEPKSVLLLGRYHRQHGSADVTLEDLSVQHFGWMSDFIDQAQVVIYFDRHESRTKVIKNHVGPSGEIISDS